MWILEQVGGVSEWLGYYVKVWIIEWASEFLREGMSGRVSQWVSDEMPEQSNEQADVCNYGNEWENEEVCELMSEELCEWICDNLGGREVQKEGESEQAGEWVWCKGAENDHFVNVRPPLDRVLITQFDWLEVSLAWNCIEYVFADQLFIMTSYDIVWFQVLIWFEHPYACTSYVCPFNDHTLPVNIITVH